MKKAFIAVIALLYLVVTSGVVVNVHYCMGNFFSVGYGQTKDRDCSKCGMEKRSSCCHTEYKLLKAGDVHEMPVVASLPPLSPAEQLKETEFPNGADVCDVNAASFTTSHAPPGVSLPAYLLNRVLRI